MPWPRSARITTCLLIATAGMSVAANAYLFTKYSEYSGVVLPESRESLVNLVRENFHDEYLSGLKDDQVLAFILTPRHKVRAKAIASRRIGESLDLILARAFPGTPLDGKTTIRGSSCFASKPGEHGKFCVLYARAAGDV